MAVTSSRTLRLLSLLQQRRHWSGADLADRLGVSIRTLRRDVDRLREVGYPVDAQPGVDGGYTLAPGAALPPLVLDDDEAVALAVGLSAAASTGIAGLAEPSVRALAKVVPVMPKRLRRRVDALRAVTVPGTWGTTPESGGADPDALTALALACRDGERLAFAYTAADGARTDRTVDPYRLVPLGAHWYLVAWDVDRGDWRVFRLDRLRGARGTGRPFAPRPLPADDVAAYVRERVSGGPERWRVEAVVDAPAADVRRRATWWLSVTDEPDGRCRVRLDVDDLLWAATALGLVGAPFTVVHPPELATTLTEVADRFMTATRAAAPLR
ncbi:helix-turn-helix transcriptional regulator [Cellulomonas shaoxiangyii]|uniref:YafY family transcriptional regulator n=1 Tax=Cellulomonas shaoxiangyii TaxID=2566013 RepID=A0A4P7SK47_9CELL|nr:YafY family protein [Cellulomonas shaoxiangyii]QCB94659.1 YafY family transcriptional regulator [Cellulomonas shaoxiangyii]TGY84712.1 YafY family transcriptional regulator [Cellulomonas shaoxiangyii]